MPELIDGKYYLVDADEVEATKVSFIVIDNGHSLNYNDLHNPEIRYWDEEDDEWYECFHDYKNDQNINPNFGRLFFEK